MGFTAGMVSSMGIGLPHYYIDSGDNANQFDKHTYVTIWLDVSGSMDDIVGPIRDALSGDYFSSGGAAGQNGVKSTTSLRAELQDFYATAGIEGSPDWNTNNATNGKNEFNKHVTFIYTMENTVFAINKIGSNSVVTTNEISQSNGNSVKSMGHADFITPSNFINIQVCNESHPYYTSGWDGNTWRNNVWTWTGPPAGTFGGNETNSEIMDPLGSGPGQPSVGYTPLQSMYTREISLVRGSLFETSLNGAGATFVSNYWNNFTHSNIWLDQQFPVLRERADGYKPSVTICILDPGLEIGNHNHTLHSSNPHNGQGNRTASQEFWHRGVIGGEGYYGTDGYITGHTYGLNDFNAKMSWNGRQNVLSLTPLTDQSQNTDVSYWKTTIRNLITSNVNI
jgi:ribosomal protein L31